jgi:hypothetical protein
MSDEHHDEHRDERNDEHGNKQQRAFVSALLFVHTCDFTPRSLLHVVS